MVERFWPKPDMDAAPDGPFIRYSDYASLQKELTERTKERDEAEWKAHAASLSHDEEIRAAEARADALAKKVEGLEAALQKDRWYVEVYDTREHNTEQDDTLTEIDAALEAKP